MESVLDLNPVKISRLFRRNNLAKTTLWGKYLCYALAILALFLFFRITIKSFLHSRAFTTQLKNEVQAIISNSNLAPTMTRETKTDFSVIARKNVFGELGAKSVPTPPPQKAVNNISLGLIGTFITKGEAPYAIIEDTKKSSQDVFLLKDKVFGDGILKAIYPDKVEIDRNGQIEVLTIDEGPAASQAPVDGVANLGQDTFSVDEAELDKALENLPLLLTQARAVPYFKDGKSVGLRLFAIRSGSLFEKIGLMNGDILKSINGNSLADFTQAMSLFQKLKEERSINITMERNNQDREFKYQIR